MSGPIQRMPFVRVLKTPSAGLLSWSCPTGWVIDHARIESLGTSTASEPAWAVVPRGGLTARPRLPAATAADTDPGSARFAWKSPTGSWALCPPVEVFGVWSRRLTSFVVWDAATSPIGGDYIQISGTLIKETFGCSD